MRQPREAVSGAGCAEVARGLGMRREQGAVVVVGWDVWVSMWAVYIIYIVIMLYYSIGLKKITKYFLVKIIWKMNIFKTHRPEVSPSKLNYQPK
jgi:hypothetical protein